VSSLQKIVAEVQQKETLKQTKRKKMNKKIFSPDHHPKVQSVQP
jgi:hypothetical protein